MFCCLAQMPDVCAVQERCGDGGGASVVQLSRLGGESLPADMSLGPGFVQCISSSSINQSCTLSRGGIMYY